MFYVGIVFISLFGTFLHFLYELTNHNKFVAIFAAVNESTWEHIKICMTAAIVWSLYDGYIYGMNPNYLVAKSLSILTIIVLIPALFYTYTAFTKKSILVVDIICFYITVIVSQMVFKYFISLGSLPFIYTYLSVILLTIEFASYMFLTFQPIKNFIFKDPISNKYGLKGHTEPERHHH